MDSIGIKSQYVPRQFKTVCLALIIFNSYRPIALGNNEAVLYVADKKKYRAFANVCASFLSFYQHENFNNLSNADNYYFQHT